MKQIIVISALLSTALLSGCQSLTDYSTSEEVDLRPSSVGNDQAAHLTMVPDWAHGFEDSEVATSSGAFEGVGFAASEDMEEAVSQARISAKFRAVSVARGELVDRKSFSNNEGVRLANQLRQNNIVKELLWPNRVDGMTLKKETVYFAYGNYYAYAMASIDEDQFVKQVVRILNGEGQ